MYVRMRKTIFLFDGKNRRSEYSPHPCRRRNKPPATITTDLLRETNRKIRAIIPSMGEAKADRERLNFNGATVAN
jgi:hypothetical protein